MATFKADVQFILLIALIMTTFSRISAFNSRKICHNFEQQRTLTRCSNWIGDLWEEVIEFSTYGPGERKLLKAKREAATQNTISTDSFKEAKRNLEKAKKQAVDDESSSSSAKMMTNGGSVEETTASISLEAFQTAVASSKSSKTLDDEEENFDGYALRDLLVSRWGVPLDIDFQRGYNNQSVYCTILPVAFGSRKCRHESELAYLMHLQGVIEVLQKYNNLELFLAFCESTTKVPKPGTDSVPYRLELTAEELESIL